MSNESENNRIDLTQFDGHTEGEWCRPSGRGSFNELSIWTWAVIDILQKVIPRAGRPYEDNIMDGKLAMSAPKLLAELKKCYERMDYHKCLLDELYSSKRMSPSDIHAIEQEVKREFYPELFHHGDGWEISGGPCECMKCQEDEASE